MPACCITRPELLGSAKSAFAAHGLPPDPQRIMCDYGLAMVESDLSFYLDPQIDNLIGCLVKGLPTTFQPEQDWKIGPLPGEPPTTTVSGADFHNLYHAMQNLYLQKWTGDGLPCGPATQEEIDWLMTGVDHDPNEIIGEAEGLATGVRTSERPCTYKLLATAMAMAGGRPEYMCVAEAMVKGITDGKITLASSMSSSPYYIANGPITDEIRLCNGFHLWGPQPKAPAGLVLARCLWFVYQNVGNMLVGKGTIGQYGDDRPGRCFAENEAGLPSGWGTYAEDYRGFARGTNCVTTGTSGMGNMLQYVPRGGGNDTLEDELSDGLDRCVTLALQIPNSGRASESKGSGLLLMNAYVTTNYANGGYTKESLLEDLASRFWYAFEDIKYKRQVQAAYESAGENIEAVDPLMHIARFTNPANMEFVNAGGTHTSQSRWFTGWRASRTFEIIKPANFVKLLADALDDLGPMPPLGAKGEHL